MLLRFADFWQTWKEETPKESLFVKILALPVKIVRYTRAIYINVSKIALSESLSGIIENTER